TLAALLAAAAVYARGWRALSSRMPARFGKGRLAAFLGGLAVIAVALASPLLWLGAPIAPSLRGLPRPIRRTVAAALASRVLRPTVHIIAQPAFGWISFALAFWIWHAA